MIMKKSRYRNSEKLIVCQTLLKKHRMHKAVWPLTAHEYGLFSDPHCLSQYTFDVQIFFNDSFFYDSFLWLRVHMVMKTTSGCPVIRLTANSEKVRSRCLEENNYAYCFHKSTNLQKGAIRILRFRNQPNCRSSIKSIAIRDLLSLTFFKVLS